MIISSQGRFQQKHDIEENWLKATNFAPLIGEIIIYDPDYDAETNPNGYQYPRFKVGIWDGNLETKTAAMLANNLPFITNGTDEYLKLINGENTVFQIKPDASIEGGLTDKDMITEMVGGLGGLLTSLSPAKANQKMSVAFGANSNTYGIGTVSIGANVSAGTMAYYFDTIDFENKTITLSSTRRSSPSTNPTYPSSISWKKGDRISIKNGTINHLMCSTITNVSGNVITVDSLPFTAIEYSYKILLGYGYTTPHDRSVVNVDRPNSGAVSLGFGAVALGGGASTATKAIGMLSTALGYETLAAGSMAIAGGKSSIAGYCSLAVGAETNALGETSAAFGTQSKATGSFAFAAGQKTEATAGASAAFGGDTHATAWGAFAEGTSSMASGQASHAEGNATKATGQSSHTEGNLTHASGDQSHAQNNSTLASGQASHAEGMFSIASGQASHAEGGGENADVATTASGSYSHGEGYRTKATGHHSHSEGALTEAIGSSSHAEGEGSIANASRSHAGGYKSTTYGANSFAHGEYTQTGYEKVISNTITCNYIDGILVSSYGLEFLSEKIKASTVTPYSYNGNLYKVRLVADGCEVYWNGYYEYSEAVFCDILNCEIASWTIGNCENIDLTIEGDASIFTPTITGGTDSIAFGKYTQANGNAQFVTGVYNAPNSTSAFIIGNGTSSKRANIHTVDWNGNAWYAGDIKAGTISLKTTTSTANTANTNATKALNKSALYYVSSSDALTDRYESGAIGLQAKGSARYGAALGWGCEVTGDHGMALGTCAWARSGQIAVGKANAPEQTYGSANKTPLFMVGNGIAEVIEGQPTATTRSNAFVVLSDGTGYLGDKKILTEGQSLGNSIKIGSTKLTEEQLIKIINLIDSLGFKGGNV